MGLAKHLNPIIGMFGLLINNNGIIPHKQQETGNEEDLLARLLRRFRKISYFLF